MSFTTLIVTVPVRNIPGTARWAGDFLREQGETPMPLGPAPIPPERLDAWEKGFFEPASLALLNLLTSPHPYVHGGRFVWGGDFNNLDERAFCNDLEPFLVKWWAEVPRSPEDDDVLMVFLQHESEQQAAVRGFTEGRWIGRMPLVPVEPN